MRVSKGDKVSTEVNGTPVTGTVTGAPNAFPGCGEVARVTLDPEYAHLVVTGECDKGTEDLFPPAG